MPQKLDRDTCQQRLAELDGWAMATDRDAISKSYKFADFNAAFAWMTRVALIAEKMDHHPEWSNVYNRVDVALTTHSAGGITELDFELAAKMESFAGSD